MSKTKSQYVCQNCGVTSPKWLGRCTECGEWNSYVEEIVEKRSVAGKNLCKAEARRLSDIDMNERETHISTGIGELDRVLGGGIVPGSAVLVGGDPGIGKSTLVLQALSCVDSRFERSLYFSGEESPSQIKMRAVRLGVDVDDIYVLTENSLEILINTIEKLKPDLVIVDSIQTIYSSEISSAPGTISQVRECSSRLIQIAKSLHMPLILIGHVTKEGAIAGPKVMEHMVDTVLYFEGERGHPFRLLRSVKNRFGATCEVGVFEMTGKGLQEVLNPSELFLEERPEGAAGSCVITSLEGSRPILVELQALVTSSGLANPRRTSIGLDSGRVGLLVAVLEKIVGLSLCDKDIFLNVAGGLKISEPAIDLGAMCSIYSSLYNKPIDSSIVVIGEVGLTGEVRAVNGSDVRLKEISKMGFNKVIIPRSNVKKKKFTGFRIEVVDVSSVEECLKLIF